MNVVVLSVGDPGGDGHGIHSNVRISCNLTSKELEAAFKKGEEIIGIRFADQFSEYDSRQLPPDMIKKMSKFFDTGFDDLADHVPNLDDDDYDEGDYGFGEDIFSDDYINLWLKIAKVGNPQLAYEFCEQEQGIDIGGYGIMG